MSLHLDDAVGETRLVRLDEQGRAVELRLERWSERETLARQGDAFAGRVTSLQPRLPGAFVDIGRGPEGFLPFKSARVPAGLHEGARVRVEIAAEAAPGKGPRLRRLPDGEEAGPVPRVLALAPSLADQHPDVARGPDARRIIDSALDEATARTLALPGGGAVTIEPTRAFVAVDVDAGDRAATTSRDAGAPARLARELNLSAVDIVARQTGLRSLAGLVVVDLVRMPDRADRDAVRARFAERLAAAGLRAEVSPVSRLGLLETAVERRARPLHEILHDASGAPSVETRALAALRRLEDEARADRGARLVLRAPADIAAWLESGGIPWRDALTERVGARFTLEARPETGPPDAGVEVFAAP